MKVAAIDGNGSVVKVLVLLNGTDLATSGITVAGCTLEDITNVEPQPGIGWTRVSEGVYTAPAPVSQVRVVTGRDVFTFLDQYWQAIHNGMRDTYPQYAWRWDRAKQLMIGYWDVDIKVTNNELVAILDGLVAIGLVDEVPVDEFLGR